MTKEKKKKKKRKSRKNLKTYVFTVIIIYLILQIVPVLKASNLKTITVKNDTLEITKTTKGIVFKDEEVHNSNAPGEINIIISEGEKVKVGQKIATTKLSGNELLNEVEKLDKDISKLKENNITNELFKGDLDKNQKNIDTISKEIRDRVFNGDYKGANELKEKLKNNVNKQEVMSGGNTYNAKIMENLIRKKEKLLEQINSGMINYYSKSTGLVSYSIDGLENIYTTERIKDYTLDDFKILKINNAISNDEDVINNGDPIFKIVNNYKWYIACKLSDINNIKSIGEGKYLTIKIEDMDEELRAKIVKKETKNKDTLLILELNSNLYNFYNNRYLNIEIVLEKYKGLIIPSTAIIERDGIKGVYIKDTSGISKYRPVKVLGKDGELVIVKKGDGLRENYIEIPLGNDTKRVKTITLYDEVFLQGDRIKEGEIVN